MMLEFGVFGVVAEYGLSIVLKATLVLVLALVAARLARHGRASVRHLLLTAAFGALLVLPLAAVVAPSVHVDIAPASLVLEEYVGESAFFGSLTPVSATDAGSATAPPPRPSLRLREFVIYTWIFGIGLFALPVLLGIVQVRRLRRTALPWFEGQRLVDALAREAGVHRPVDALRHEAIEAPATSGIGHHAILFPVDVDAWSDEDVVRAAVHEVEHVRRADCVVNALTRLICAIYWFHPLVWVAWGRLGLEAERACDDAVLRRAEATSYANQLITLASRLSRNARHPLLAMANRSDLVQRVAAVLDERQARGHVGLLLGASIAVTACLLTVVVSPLQAVSASPTAVVTRPGILGPGPNVVPTQRFSVPIDGSINALPPGSSATRVSATAREFAATAQTAAGAPASFEVASVRRNTSGGVPRMRVEGGRFVASNTSLVELILDAYRMQSFQVVGGPEWRQPAPGPNRAAPASQRPGEVTFDVIANIPQDTPPAQVPLMLRALLVDRFKLVVHTEMRDMPVYLLTYARDDKRLGPQLSTSPQQCQSEIDAGPLRAPVTRVSDDGKPLCSLMISPAAIRGGGLTTRFLANALTVYTRRMVVDRTALEGPFDFTLMYAPAARGGGPAPADDRPSIFTAVQEQLGLKLESATAPVEVLVIDSVSIPTEN